MKKYISIFAMAQMIIWSCAKPEIDSPVSVVPDGDAVVFTALADADMTRTAPAAGGVVSWTMEDEIGVYDGKGYVKATLISVEGNKVTFSAQVDREAAEYIAVSPYEAALTDDGRFTLDGDNVKLNTALASQTAGKQVVSIAATTASTEPFAFKNVCNLLRFKVNKQTVKQAKITGANAEKIAGVLSVDPSTGAATGTLTETEIVTPVTPGEDNFIALAPGTSLPEGFVITLYGDKISDAGYEGEVASAGEIDFTGDKARNRMLNLGLIDGWIDNWALWQKGKPITIAGVEYSKESTGVLGSILSADDAGQADLFTQLYGKGGVYFLEQSSDSKFSSTNFINIGNATAALDMFLISRYDNAPVDFYPTQRLNLSGSGSLYIKGVNIDIKDSGVNYICQTGSAIYENLVLDNCKMVLHSGDSFLYLNGTKQLGVKNVKIVNSEIQSTHTDRVILINTTDTFAQWNNIETVTLDNNFIYNSNVDARFTIMGDKAPQPSNGDQRTVVTVTNNTFYNMSARSFVYLKTYSLGGLTVTGNIFYSQSALTAYSNIAQSTDTANEYSYTIDRNVSNLPRLSYFNPNQPGYNQTSGLYLNPSSDLSFSVADAENGIFTPVAAYASYGAQR